MGWVGKKREPWAVEEDRHSSLCSEKCLCEQGGKVFPSKGSTREGDNLSSHGSYGRASSLGSNGGNHAHQTPSG